MSASNLPVCRIPAVLMPCFGGEDDLSVWLLLLLVKVLFRCPGFGGAVGLLIGSLGGGMGFEKSEAAGAIPAARLRELELDMGRGAPVEPPPVPIGLRGISGRVSGCAELAAGLVYWP